MGNESKRSAVAETLRNEILNADPETAIPSSPAVSVTASVYPVFVSLFRVEAHTP